MTPVSIPAGTPYLSPFFGGLVVSTFEGKLTYRWSRGGLPYYVIPILGGHVHEWIPAEHVEVTP